MFTLDEPLRYLALKLEFATFQFDSLFAIHFHDVQNGIIYKLFLILGAACVGTAIAGNKRIAIPLVVAEILSGAAVGKSGLNWLRIGPELNDWSIVAFAILLFLVGTNLPLRDPKIKAALNMGIAATLASYALAIPVAIGVASLTHFAHVGIVVLLVACSSTSIVLRMINERKLSGPGLTMTTTWIPLADMSTLASLPLAMSQGKTLQVIVGTLIIIGVGGLVLIFIKKFENSDSGSHYKQLSKKRDWAWQMKYYLFALFGLCLLSQLVGVTSTIVAGFVMGATATLVGVPKRFAKELLGLGEGLFIPLFFVTLGAKLDIRALFTSVANMELALCIAAGALVVHLLVAKLLRLPLPSGFMAASSMGLPAAIVSTGLSDNLIEPGQGAAIIAAALISLGFASLGVTLFERQNPPVPKRKKSDNDGHEPLQMPSLAADTLLPPVPVGQSTPELTPAHADDEPSVVSTHEIGT
ncbi:MAG: cation:proton antiporter [Candidatus Obscuribacterales bacterium]|nr:cation:proton antiporter [Candidatus Obscuribacterales bacterium]